jgi:hypothetical protein
LYAGRAVLRFDPTEWRKGNAKKPGETELEHVEGDVFFKVIAERIQVPIDQMPMIVLDNAHAVSPDAKITRQGFRTLNGVRVLWIELEGSASGIPFIYYYHVYSGPLGTVQLIGYTSKNLMNQYRSAIERLASGFEIVDK